MIDLDDDMQEILSTDDFGLSFVYNGNTHHGILTEAFYDGEGDTTGFAGYKPVLISNLTIPRGTVLNLNGNNYEVVMPEPNVFGNVQRIILHAL